MAYLNHPGPHRFHLRVKAFATTGPFLGLAIMPTSGRSYNIEAVPNYKVVLLAIEPGPQSAYERLPNDGY